MEKYIPFSMPSIGQEEIDAVVDTLKSGWITTGKKTKQFEVEVAKKIGSKFGCALNSATGGLFLSMKALGVEGKKVITTPFTFCATYNTVVENNAELIFADIDEDFNISVKEIEKKIKGASCVVPVHFAGLPCDMTEINAMAKKEGVSVVEDAAHALGTFYKGKPIGHEDICGDTTVFSFYATKNITTGEGGMVTTLNQKLADLITILGLHGMSKNAWKRNDKNGSWKYDVDYLGYKYNMTDIAASMGMEQLKKLDYFMARRKFAAEYYLNELKDLDGIILPKIYKDKVSAWHLFMLRIDGEKLTIGRDGFIEKMKEYGIGTGVHVISGHLQPYYVKRFGFKPSDFPVSERMSKEVVSIPVSPSLSDEDIYYIANSIKEIARKYRR